MSYDDDHSKTEEKPGSMDAIPKQYGSEETVGLSMQDGVARVEAAQAVWNSQARWALYAGLALASYAYSLDGSTTWQFLSYASSTVLEHSLSGVVSTAGAIIIAVGKPFIAVLSDHLGRAETYILVLFLYAIGYAVIASAPNIGQIAGGTIIYSLGYTGLQLLTQIVLADVTSLRWRGMASGLVTMPFVINCFVAAEIAQGVLPNWRVGYGMFAVIVPVCLLPVIGALLWGQWKAKKLAPPRPSVFQRSAGVFQGFSKKQWPLVAAKAASRKLVATGNELDIIGLVLVAASLALILLPLGLAKTASKGWSTPSMIVMIVLGIVLFPVFVAYEIYVAPKPFAPVRFFKNRTIAAACAIGFLDFFSFYLQYTYQYSFVYIVKSDWSARELSYFSSTQTLGLCIFALLGGLIMAKTRSYKWLLFSGLLIRLFGVGLMIHARGANGPTAELVMCQVIQSIGGGFAAVTLQVSAQAHVAHKDVAAVTALVLLITEIGNSVGSAVATAIWTNTMPGQLAKHIPSANSTVIDGLYANILSIAAYPADSPVKIGAIAAYEEVMKRLCIAATVVAIFPPIICWFFSQDAFLGNQQNAFDGRDTAGRPTGEGEVHAAAKA